MGELTYIRLSFAAMIGIEYLDKLQTGNSSLYPFQLTFKPLITMLPVVAGSSSFTIIDDVWNSFSFDVQGSLIPTWLLSIGHYSIEYPCLYFGGCWLCLYIIVFSWVDVSLLLYLFLSKTFPATTAAVQWKCSIRFILCTVGTRYSTDQKPTNLIFGALIFERHWIGWRTAIFIIAHCAQQENSW